MVFCSQGDVSPGVATSTFVVAVQKQHGKQEARDEAAAESRYEQLASRARLKARRLFEKNRAQVLKEETVLEDAVTKSLDWFAAAK